MITERLTAWYGAYLWRQFEGATRDPAGVQQRVLHSILRRNAGTAFGVAHGFKSVRSVADFQKAVPIRKYDGFSDWVERVAAGEQAVLTGEPVVFFNQSSGTAGKPKLIPVTRSAIRETGRLRVIWGTRTSRMHPQLLRGKSISVVYADGGKTPGGIQYGSLSGQVYSQSPASLRRRYALPFEIARIGDPESKQYAAMRLAVVQNVTFLFSTNAATVLSMVETAERRQEEMIRDIHDGTLSANLALPDGVRDALEALCSANPEGARRLARIADAHGGRLRPMDYWPDCSVLGCWLGSTVGLRAKQLPEWFGPNLVVRDVGLAASEGVFTLPTEDNQPFGPLTVDTSFYEFIPVEAEDEPEPSVLTAEQLEVDREYVLVVTTTSGLYRYNINDVVRVVGHFHGTPMLEFSRKGSDCTNLAGEKLNIVQIMAALEAAQKASGVVVSHFRVQADGGEFRYRFHVELENPGSRSCSLLEAALECSLREANYIYDIKVQEKQLKPLLVCLMKPGWFDRYVADAMARGARHGQFKPTLLSMKPEPLHERAESA
jgi:hypothetical protein